MKKFIKELTFTNYRFNKKGRLVGIKGSEKLLELAFHECDLCGVVTTKVAAIYAGFTPIGWSVLTTTSREPLGDDLTYDLCEACTPIRSGEKQ